MSVPLLPIAASLLIQSLSDFCENHNDFLATNVANRRPSFFVECLYKGQSPSNMSMAMSFMRSIPKLQRGQILLVCKLPNIVQIISVTPLKKEEVFFTKGDVEEKNYLDVLFSNAALSYLPRFIAEGVASILNDHVVKTHLL